MLKILLPMLLTFLAAKIIIQTDIIMLAPLGQKVLAAFAVPMRVMLVDIIAAFAIAPVVGIMISSASTTAKRNELTIQALSFSIYLSLVLTLIGLALYPIIINMIIKDPSVTQLAENAVFWLTLAIPARLIQFVCSMIFFGSNRGNYLIPIYVISIILNGLLNWVFIYYFKLGFSGSYLSTFIVSYLEAIYSLFLLRRDAPFFMLIKFPKLCWLKQFFGNIGAEFGRLVSWQVLSFVLLSIFSVNILWTTQLSVYAVAMEFYTLLTIPLIAVMRSTAILLAKHTELNSTQLYGALKNIVIKGLPYSLLVCVLLVYFGADIGRHIYHLSAQSAPLWNTFIWTMAFILPLYYLNAFQRGIWQARKKFNQLFILELFISWPVLLLTIYYGLVKNNAWILWSGMLIIEIIVAITLFCARKKLDLLDNSNLNAIGNPGRVN